MVRKFAPLCLTVLLLALAATSALAAVETLEIDVAPQVLQLNAQGTWLTIHTNLPLAEADAGTVLLDGSLAPSQVFADDCGNLVAKFPMTDVKPYVTDDQHTFTLSVDTTAGTTLVAEDTVTVRTGGSSGGRTR